MELFCDVDDSCHQFIPQWETQLITDGACKRRRSSTMSFGEKMTIMISFHQSNHRDFKSFYIGLVQRYWTEYFPNLISYTRFINTIFEVIVPMCTYFKQLKVNR